MRGPLPVLALTALWLGCGCTRQTAEIKVRDPGRVQVALREPPPPTPVLLPDGRPAAFSVGAPGSGGPGVLVRRGRTVVFEHPNESTAVLVDEQGQWASTPTTDRVQVLGPFLYSAYDLVRGRAYQAGRAPEGHVAVELSTPLDNVESAELRTERRKWPAYVFLPLGAVFTIVGSVLLASSDEKLTRVAGGFYLAVGLPMMGYGTFVLADSPSSVPILPSRRP